MMVRGLTVVIFSVLAGCGFRVNNSEHAVGFSGQSTVAVRLEFINEIKELCDAAHRPAEYPNSELRNEAVAECVFERLALFNLTDLFNDYCEENIEDDLCVESL